MNQFLEKLLRLRLRLQFRRKEPDFTRLRKSRHDLEVELKNEFFELFRLIVGVLSATFGIKGFLIPNAFIDGGVMGISLIVNAVSDFPLSVLVFAFNLPFLILAFIAINRRFAIKSIVGIIFLSLAIAFLPVPAVTDDKILTAAFGGFFLGLGIGMAIRGGAIIDGTEVLAIYLSRKTSLSVGNVILIFNILIFLTAAYVLSTEIALYAILTYFAASHTVDFVIDGIEEFMGVSIVSDKSEEIRKAITEYMGRGCTLLKGRRGYARAGSDGQGQDIDVVYTVITRLEMTRLTTEIDKIDPNAFVIMTSVKDTKGGMLRKKPLKKIE